LPIPPRRGGSPEEAERSPVQNAEIARVSEQVADLLEIQEANPFRVRAYRTAAETVRGRPRALHQLVRKGEGLSRLPGIGKDLAGKIAEIVRRPRAIRPRAPKRARGPRRGTSRSARRR